MNRSHHTSAACRADSFENSLSESMKALVCAGAELYEVGGPVRDRLMGRQIKDHDLLCRHISPRKITSLLKPYGKVATVGKSFGVIKFSPHRNPELEVDIALPRRERSTGVGHRDFEVDFDPEMPIEADLGRRDFTINAMACKIASDEIIDPFGGRNDLEQKLLRMVFPKAFEEDPLRLIRAVQFAARFGLTIEADTWEAMNAASHLITTVSGERIAIELAKLMSAPKPSVGFDLMLRSGILGHIMPELVAVRGIEQDKQPGDDVYFHTMRALDAARSDSAVENRGDMDLMFAVLLHDIGKAKTVRFHPPSGRVVFFGHQLASSKLAKRIIERLKLSMIGVSTASVLILIQNHMFETKAHFTDRAIRRFVAKVGVELIRKLLDLRIADNRGGKHPSGIKGVQRLRKRIEEELAKKPPFGPKDLAINGYDLMEIGVTAGPMMGALLAMLVEHVLDEPLDNTKERLLALASSMKENPSILEQAILERKREQDRESGESDFDSDTEAPGEQETGCVKGSKARGQGR